MHPTLTTLCAATAAVALLPAAFLAYPSVYPTGTTMYLPAKAWNGYTIHGTPDAQGAVLVDMNGNLVKRWEGVAAVQRPFRILPGGYVMYRESEPLRELGQIIGQPPPPPPPTSFRGDFLVKATCSYSTTAGPPATTRPIQRRLLAGAPSVAFTRACSRSTRSPSGPSGSTPSRDIGCRTIGCPVDAAGHPTRSQRVPDQAAVGSRSSGPPVVP